MPAPLVVAEVFGPTLQGEGPSAGRLAAFVRLGRCHLACAWCDEPQTWDWSRYDAGVELSHRAADDVLAQLDAIGAPLLVVTGGEPLLQQARLVPLLAGAKARGWEVEVETSGTLAPTLADGLVDRYNVSPKLASSGNPRERRFVPEALRVFRDSGRAVFKFVVAEVGELDEVAEMVDECGLGDVWIMPEGTDAAVVLARLRRLAPHVVARGWNLTSRLHVMIGGDRRGV